MQRPESRLWRAVEVAGMVAVLIGLLAVALALIAHELAVQSLRELKAAATGEPVDQPMQIETRFLPRGRR